MGDGTQDPGRGALEEAALRAGTGFRQANLRAALYQRALRSASHRPPEREGLVTLDEAIASYLLPYEGTTKLNYEWALRSYAHYLTTAGIHWQEASRTIIEEWATSLLRAGYEKSSVSIRLIPIRGLYRWAASERIMTTNISAAVRAPHRPPRSVQRWFSQGQARQILAATKTFPRDLALATHLFLLNGLRLQDALNAHGENIGRIEEHTTLYLPHRKGDLMQTIGLPQATVNLLPRNLDGPLVSLNKWELYTEMDHLGAAAKVGRIRPHMLRATFITLALDAGVPARDVMASAGHGKLETTAYYDRAYASIRRNAAYRLADYLG